MHRISIRGRGFVRPPCILAPEEPACHLLRLKRTHHVFVPSAFGVGELRDAVVVGGSRGSSRHAFECEVALLSWAHPAAQLRSLSEPYRTADPGSTGHPEHADLRAPRRRS